MQKGKYDCQKLWDRREGLKGKGGVGAACYDTGNPVILYVGAGQRYRRVSTLS